MKKKVRKKERKKVVRLKKGKKGGRYNEWTPRQGQWVLIIKKRHFEEKKEDSGMETLLE